MSQTRECQKQYHSATTHLLKDRPPNILSRLYSHKTLLQSTTAHSTQTAQHVSRSNGAASPLPQRTMHSGVARKAQMPPRQHHAVLCCHDLQVPSPHSAFSSVSGAPSGHAPVQRPCGGERVAMGPAQASALPLCHFLCMPVWITVH